MNIFRLFVLWLGAVVGSVAAWGGVSGTLPVVYVETAGGVPVVSKTDYVDATCRIDSLGAVSDVMPLQIRGRGHSSWKGVKKPYKLRFADKQPLMGMASNRHWALLKPTETTIAGLELGRLMGMRWTPSLRPVEVVLNGDYLGLYFLTETVRIGRNRVNIFEQADMETDPEVIPGGWLVEIDNYRDECQITVAECARWNLTVRYHSPERLSPEQSAWLTDEFRIINRAIYSPDKRSVGWEEHIDVDAMARFFVLQEVMDNPDGFHGSFYLHKDLAPGAKWVAGPVWDLTCYNRQKTDYTFRMKVHYGFTPHWIGELMEYDSFCRAVGDVWAEVYPERLEEIYAHVDSLVSPLARAWRCDAERWGDDPEFTAAMRVERINGALEGNIAWFADHLPQSSVSAVGTVAAVGVTGVYDLQGRYVGESDDLGRLPRGLYIVNGRKCPMP